MKQSARFNLHIKLCTFTLNVFLLAAVLKAFNTESCRVRVKGPLLFLCVGAVLPSAGDAAATASRYPHRPDTGGDLFH